MAQDKFGHRPFEKLKGLARPRPPAPRAPPPPPAMPSPSEAELFARAMAGVRPLNPGPTRVLGNVEGRLPDPLAEDREMAAALTALVQGEVRFELSDGDEFIEGAVPDLDRRTRARLRRGEFSVQAHLDLHGLTRDEAHPALEGFVQQQRGLGRRCVLVVHGRGKNSPAGIPVLKEQMGRWLSRGSLGRAVLGFCTARPTDGGAGALYVLLRR